MIRYLLIYSLWATSSSHLFAATEIKAPDPEGSEVSEEEDENPSLHDPSILLRFADQLIKNHETLDTDSTNSHSSGRYWRLLSHLTGIPFSDRNIGQECVEKSAKMLKSLLKKNEEGEELRGKHHIWWDVTQHVSQHSLDREVFSACLENLEIFPERFHLSYGTLLKSRFMVRSRRYSEMNHLEYFLKCSPNAINIRDLKSYRNEDICYLFKHLPENHPFIVELTAGLLKAVREYTGYFSTNNNIMLIIAKLGRNKIHEKECFAILSRQTRSLIQIKAFGILGSHGGETSLTCLETLKSLFYRQEALNSAFYHTGVNWQRRTCSEIIFRSKIIRALGKIDRHNPMPTDTFNSLELALNRHAIASKTWIQTFAKNVAFDEQRFLSEGTEEQRETNKIQIQRVKDLQESYPEIPLLEEFLANDSKTGDEARSLFLSKIQELETKIEDQKPTKLVDDTIANAEFVKQWKRIAKFYRQDSKRLDALWLMSNLKTQSRGLLQKTIQKLKRVKANINESFSEEEVNYAEIFLDKFPEYSKAEGSETEVCEDSSDTRIRNLMSVLSYRRVGRMRDSGMLGGPAAKKIASETIEKTADEIKEYLMNLTKEGVERCIEERSNSTTEVETSAGAGAGASAGAGAGTSAGAGASAGAGVGAPTTHRRSVELVEPFGREILRFLEDDPYSS